MQRQLAKGQYATVIATIGLNLTLSLVLTPSEYGKYALGFLGVIFLVTLFDPGANSLFVSGKISPTDTLVLKIQCLVISSIIILIFCFYRGNGFPDAFSALFVLFGYVSFSTIDSNFLRKQNWAKSARCRTVAALLLCTLPLGASKFSGKGEIAITVVGFSFTVAGAITGEISLNRMRQSGGLLISALRVHTSQAVRVVAAAGINFPSNLISNGLVLMIGVAGTAEEVARGRLLMLAAGGVMALAPASPLQMLAAKGQKAESLRIRTTIASLATSTLAAALVPIMLPILYQDRYPGLISLTIVSICAVPLLATMLTKLQLAIGVWGTRRCTLVSLLSAAVTISIAVVTGPALLVPFGLVVMGLSLGVLLFPIQVARSTRVIEIFTAVAAVSGIGLYLASVRLR